MLSKHVMRTETMRRNILLSLVLLMASWSLQAQAPRSVAVETASARTELVSPALWVPGTVISRHDSRIASEVSGKLLDIAEVGDRFEKGEVIARVNDRELQLQLRNNRAEKKRLQARKDYLERQVVRLGRLAKTNSAAEAELDQISAERDMLTQEIEAAQVNIERTLYDIERTRITAPFDGVVVERMRQPGEFLSDSNDVARLVNTDELEIRVQAPLKVARHVEAGDSVRVTNRGEEIDTRVRTIVPVGDDNSRMLQLRLEYRKAKWIIGEAVRVALSHGIASERLTVPRDALVLRNGRTYLFKVEDDDIARQVDVVTSEGAGSYVAVEGDIASGDKVVIRGAERLRDGSTVKILNNEVVGR